MDEPCVFKRDASLNEPSDDEDPPPLPDHLEPPNAFFGDGSSPSGSDSASPEIAPREGGNVERKWAAVAPNPSDDPAFYGRRILSARSPQ